MIGERMTIDLLISRLDSVYEKLLNLQEHL